MFEKKTRNGIMLLNNYHVQCMKQRLIKEDLRNVEMAVVLNREFCYLSLKISHAF